MRNLQKITSPKNKLLFKNNPDWNKILELRKEVQENFTDNGYLGLPTFNKILDWNMPNQKTQIIKILENTPESVLRNITQCYFNIEHDDEAMRTRIKAGVLLSIPWIGIKNASAILSFHQPKQYGIIDSQSWRILFQKTKTNFTGNDYLSYLSSMRELAESTSFDLQKIDFILKNTDESF